MIPILHLKFIAFAKVVERSDEEHGSKAKCLVFQFSSPSSTTELAF